MSSKILFDWEEIETLVNLLYKSEKTECREFAKELDQLQQVGFESVVQGLHNINVLSKLMTIFEIAELSIRQRIAYILGSIPDTQALKSLVSVVSNKEEEIELRGCVIWVLANHPTPQIIGLLIENLSDPEPRIRAAAAEALGRLGDKRAVEPLLTLLYDEDLSVRIVTVWALVNLKDSRAVEPLLGIMADKTEPIEVRRGAIAALERIGDKRAIPVFVEALNSQDKYLQHVSIEGLGKLGDEDIKLLLESLLEKDIPVKHKGQRRKKTIIDAIAAIEARQSSI